VVPRFHHVNLGVLPEQVDDEMAWLVEVLGYRRMAITPELNAMGARWFEADDGSQVHLSTDEEHHPARRAHVAIELDDIDAVSSRLSARGQAFEANQRDGMTVLLCRDPAGNRWELRSVPVAATQPA